MEDPNASNGYLFAHKVNIKLNVLRAAMMNGVGGKIDGRDVIIVYHRSLRNVMMQLLKQLWQSSALGDDVSYNSVLCLGTGARHHGAFRRPRDEGGTKVDTTTKGRTSRIRTASQISME